MPTNTLRDNDPQHPILSAVRESQTALVDVVRSWTDITEQLTRRLPLPVAGIDVAGAVDRTFDLAEQTLAAQRQFALTLVGAVDRQVDTIVETAESSAHQSLRGVEDGLPESRGQPAPAWPQAPRAADRRQGRGPEGRDAQAERHAGHASQTGAASRSATSRSCATGPASWRSMAAPR